MKDFDLDEETVIDLGQASVETKGSALFENDTGAGQLRYVTGMADD